MKQHRAIITKRFYAVPDGLVQTRLYNPGDEITGEVALIAVTSGHAEFAEAVEAKARAAAPENKAKDGTFQGDDGGHPGERSKPKRGGSGTRKKAPSRKA